MVIVKDNLARNINNLSYSYRYCCFYRNPITNFYASATPIFTNFLAVGHTNGVKLFMASFVLLLKFGGRLLLFFFFDLMLCITQYNFVIIAHHGSFLLCNIINSQALDIKR